MNKFLNKIEYIILAFALLIMFATSFLSDIIILRILKIKKSIRRKTSLSVLVWALFIMFVIMFTLINTNKLYMSILTLLESLLLVQNSYSDILIGAVYVILPSILIGFLVWISPLKGSTEFDRLISPFFPIIMLMVFYASTPIVFVELQNMIYNKVLPLYDGNTTSLIEKFNNDFKLKKITGKDYIVNNFEDAISTIEKQQLYAQFPYNYAYDNVIVFLKDAKKNSLNLYDNKTGLFLDDLNSTLYKIKNTDQERLRNSIYNNNFIYNTQIILNNPYKFFGKIILTLLIIIISIFSVALMKALKEEKKDIKSQNTLLMMTIYSSYVYTFIINFSDSSDSYLNINIIMGGFIFVLSLSALLVVLKIPENERTNVISVIGIQTFIFSIMLFIFHTLIPEAIIAIVNQYASSLAISI